MQAQAKQKLDEQVAELTLKHGRARSSLIPILQDVQDEQGYLSREAVVRIGSAPRTAGEQDLRRGHVLQPVPLPAPGQLPRPGLPRHGLPRQGLASVLEAVKRELKIEPGQTTRDGLFSLEVVACIGACGLAPVICVNGEFHAGVQPEQLKKILSAYRKEAKNDGQPSEA